ncbi:hypothetical protein [[Flexibacter] sp. ATCC 35208]|uniref:hypothetical protein n=1 Tax=[Flexibacter] sp. ATCC 35208 TaxID=1936242 RepID=UPI0009C98A5F|nr:hypothetical protein [[Flexibacter] sp. ATCC 35208]OMP74716.1 hypothetical protein BW716_33880 [[Flexibacter] sp. ATCC 35208]
MRNNSIKQWLSLLVIATMSIACFGYEKAVREFKEFNSASLDGKVIFLDGTNGYYHFKLDNDPKKYGCRPVSADNFGISFDEVALGNNLKKMPHADTLIVIEKGYTYKYVFKIFEDQEKNKSGWK